MGRSAFERKWGSNHNLRNAFDKCVSSMDKHGHGDHHD